MIRKAIKQSGFTIVELMIATMTFSTILIVVTVGIIKINNSFYKGVNSSNTQDTARSVMDDIAQNIQFGGGSISPTAIASYPTASLSTYAVCVGSVRYSVQLDYELTDSNPDNHALVKDDGCPGSVISGITGSPTPIPTSAKELLSRGMRVGALTVTQVSSKLYNIHVRIIYGDNDLLVDGPDADTLPDTCKGGAGQQFCSVADLTTTVEKRTP